MRLEPEAGRACGHGRSRNIQFVYTMIRAAILLMGVSLVSAAGSDEFFESKVRPIFATKCQGCHSGKQPRAGLDLTSANGFVKGADSGPVVNTAKPEESALLRAVGYLDKIKMPPTGRLSDAEVEAITAWVKSGAKWPGATAMPAATATAPKPGGFSRAQKAFWSFQPLKKVELPEPKQARWVRSPIDRFLLAKLEEKGLQPAAEADKLTLLRRATYDLTGLPPTEADIKAFLADESPKAFEKVVDRLLDSPRYGEKWGRHWLDVARYADSTGADEDHRYVHSWRYRDYVIDAFNRDMPYNEFLKEQIAGDLLPAPPGHDVNVRGTIATGFLALGPKLIAEQDKLKMFYDTVDEEIDVMGKTVLGLTVACARCHDHKFDPITTKDYYALASIFASTKQFEKLEGTVSKLYFAPLSDNKTAQTWADHQKRIEDKQKEIDGVVGNEAKAYRTSLMPRIAEYMLAARQVYEKNGKVDEIAAAQKLKADVLRRWVDYLKPQRERRVHIEKWQNAPAEAWPETARAYQQAFEATVTLREDAMAKWKAASAEAKAKGVTPPEAPKFFPGDDRFYTETTSGKGPMALPEKKETVFSAEATAKYAALQEEMKAIKAAAPPEPPFACGFAEGKIVDQPVFHRGNPEAKGEIVPKRFPVILAGENQPPVKGSGRLELAEWVASGKNPLPVRVVVNRIWQWHFGEGIVRTPSNFGITGERPTHPELLEWLSNEFMAQGWSFKKMHRLLMLSSAYRMSSEVTEDKTEKDADNRLVSRFPMRRLTVEEMRDTMLLLDGSIDLAVGGTMLAGKGTDKEFSDDRKSLDPDNSTRRMVYLPLRRSNLASVLNLFDFGDATTHNEIRSQTNVAPQALYMMNSRFVAQRAVKFADRLKSEAQTDRERVETAWLRAVGRPPQAQDIDDALTYVARFPAANGNGNSVSPWASYCRALISSNDFLYVH